MKERHNRNGKRLRIIPLVLGIYGGFLGFGLAVIGLAEIREGIGVARLLLGAAMAGFGLLGIWDGVRDLVRPNKRPEKPAPSQLILTDISGNRSSNVTMERLREQVESLMESDRAANFQLQILPPISVAELGRLNWIFCTYHNALTLTAFFERAEGINGTCHKSAGQDEAEEWFAKLLNGSPDFSGWEKMADDLPWEESACAEEDGLEEADSPGEEETNEPLTDLEKADEADKVDGASAEAEQGKAYPKGAKVWGNQLLNQGQKGMAYWHKLLVIFGESWHDEHKFFSVRDVELAVEGIQEGKYLKVVLEWGYEVFNLFPGVQNELMVIWRTGNTGRGDIRFLAREGTVTQVKFWLAGYLDRGFFAEMSGWADVTARIEKKK